MTLKKDKIKTKIPAVEVEKIIIVEPEIESWYLAGLDSMAAVDLGIRSLEASASIEKEKFDSLIPKKYNSRIDFMAEVIKKFSSEIAVKNSSSFQYFFKRFCSIKEQNR
jgi:hypothetical protein